MSYTWTKEQIANLKTKTYVESITEKGGLYFEKEFMDQMYKAWSEERKLDALKSFLITNDFGKENISREFLYALRTRLIRKYEKRAGRGTSDNNIPEIRHDAMYQFTTHPLVTKKISGHYSLNDEFCVHRSDT